MIIEQMEALKRDLDCKLTNDFKSQLPSPVEFGDGVPMAFPRSDDNEDEVGEDAVVKTCCSAMVQHGENPGNI